MLNTLSLPFNKHIQIEKTEDQSPYIFKLELKAHLLNHLNTMHASAMFALAEAASGEHLLRLFEDYTESVMPVLRSAQVKYSKPVTGSVFSMVELRDNSVSETISELDAKGRVLLKVDVSLYNEMDVRVFKSTYEWFLMKKD